VDGHGGAPGAKLPPGVFPTTDSRVCFLQVSGEEAQAGTSKLNKVRAPALEGRGLIPTPPFAGGPVNKWQDGRAPPRIALHQVQIPAHGEEMVSFLHPRGGGW